MNVCETEIKRETFRFAKEAFDAFCVDVETMFGIELKCRPQEQQNLNSESLKKHFKKLCAVNTIEAQGAIDGNFYLILNQEAMFTLAGIFVMLPENKILENREFGTKQQALEMGNAIEDAGNLLVGALDRVFRENVETHKHFLRAGTFIGYPWRDIQKSFGIEKGTALTVCFYELTAGNLPPFSCCVAFPETAFAKVAEMEQTNDLQEKSIDNNISEIPVLKANDVMNKNVIWCLPDCVVEKAIEQMQQANAKYLLVGSEQKAQGIIAKSDLSSAVSIYLKPMFAKWKRQLDEATLKIKIQCIMSKPVRTVSPETTFDVVVEQLVQQGGCLVVVDKKGKALGTITGRDCLANFHKYNNVG
jgi:predicted transcriptional regulator